MPMTESGDTKVPVAQKLILLLSPDEAPQYSRDITLVAERVFEALRLRLSSVLGVAGYSTLLARSFVLTRDAYPWLAQIGADKTGSLLGRLEATMQEQDFAEAARGVAAVLTRFTTLLITFIGADLTNRLLETVWQDLETGNADERPGENNL